MSFYQGQADRGTLLIPKWNLTYPGKIPLKTIHIETQRSMIDGVEVWRSWYGFFESWTSCPFDFETWLMVDSGRPDERLLGRVQITLSRGQGSDQPIKYDFEGKGKLSLERDQLELPV